jgi:hypothetical protein
MTPGYFGGLNRGGEPDASLSGLLRIRTTEGAEPTDKPKGYPVIASPLEDGMQPHVKEGDFMFGLKKNISSDGRVTLYPIWAFNYHCEREYRQRRMHTVDPLKRKTRDEEASHFIRFPLSINDYHENWCEAGPVMTVMPASTGSINMYKIGFAGTTLVPNLWQEVDKGTLVGGFLKETISPLPYFVDPHGAKLGDRTPGKFIQFIPIKFVDGVPTFCTNVLAPQKEDLCYMETTEHEGDTFQYHGTPYDEAPGGPSGLVNHDAPSGSAIITFEKLNHGKVVRFGIVKQHTLPSTDQQVDMALRTYKGWQDLMDSCPCTIDYMPYDCEDME